MDFYDRVDLLLRKKKVSAKRMCRELEISYSTYFTQKRRRTKNIPATQAIDIAKYLDANVEYLTKGLEAVLPQYTPPANTIVVFEYEGEYEEYQLARGQMLAVKAILEQFKKCNKNDSEGKY